MIFFRNILLFFFIIFFLTNCAKNEKKSVIVEESAEQQMIRALQEGYDEFREGDSLYAAKKFNEAELLFPQSSWAPKAALLAAYVYYAQDYYFDAESELKRFIKTYPRSPDMSYAHYLLAMCYYEKIVDEKKDIGPLLLAQEKFNFIIKTYPNSDYALDAQYKLDLIQDYLASKEMYIASHYMKKKKWIASINRYKTVVEQYQKTIYVEEALHRLVELYFTIGLENESQRYASLLGYNYQSSKWYEKSYKIFNKKYKSKLEKKKEKKGMLKKFKKLFD
ncbi:outer membrane protein assembly factor BamD [Candidatus Pelagibacter sp.]|nr:outer membrane protein assembly factor BamD [Candidatus Pelagibacter sp.]